MLSRQVLAGLDDPCDAAIAHAQPPMLAALALEFEAERVAADRHVLIAQRGQPKTAVLPRVVGVADTEQRQVEQANHGGQHFLPRQTSAAQVAVDLAPELWQRL